MVQLPLTGKDMLCFNSGLLLLVPDKVDSFSKWFYDKIPEIPTDKIAFKEVEKLVVSMNYNKQNLVKAHSLRPDLLKEGHNGWTQVGGG